MTAAARSNFSRRESDDGYQPVVAVLADRWRVIECRDGFQWIVQYLASSKTARRTEWKGVCYVRTRAGLIASCDRSVPEISLSALAILHALPKHIDGDARPARKSEASAGGKGYDDDRF